MLISWNLSWLLHSDNKTPEIFLAKNIWTWCQQPASLTICPTEKRIQQILCVHEVAEMCWMDFFKASDVSCLNQEASASVSHSDKD